MDACSVVGDAGKSADADEAVWGQTGSASNAPGPAGLHMAHRVAHVAQMFSWCVLEGAGHRDSMVIML